MVPSRLILSAPDAVHVDGRWVSQTDARLLVFGPAVMAVAPIELAGTPAS